MCFEKMIDLICEKRCVWYKPGRNEEERCGGFDYLFGNAEALQALKTIDTAKSSSLDDPVELSHDSLLNETICKVSCPFPPEGCDLRNPQSPHQGAPCGGVVAIDDLLKIGKISISRKG